MKSIFIKCQCHGEGLGVDYDPDDDYYYFSYWSNGLSNKKLSLRERLRYCWQVLRKGKAFEDELILTSKEVEELIKFLNWQVASKHKGFPVGDVDFGANME